MRAAFPVPLSLALVALLAACSSPSDRAAAPAQQNQGTDAARARVGSGATARTAFEKARERARAWQADARLQKVSTLYANREGKVPTEAALGLMFAWQFIYMSESTKKAIVIDSNGAQAESKDLDTWGLFQPMSEEFVDSDRALAEAVQNGLTADEAQYMELTLQWGSKQFSEPTWVIGPTGHTQYLVSGRSGKFVGRVAP